MPAAHGKSPNRPKLRRAGTLAVLLAALAALAWLAPRLAPLERDGSPPRPAPRAPDSPPPALPPPERAGLELVAPPGDDAVLLFLRGRARLEAGEPEVAAGLLAAAHAARPREVAICSLLAHTYDQLNLIRDALSLLPCLEGAERETYAIVRPQIDALRRSEDEAVFEQAVSDHFMASHPPEGPAARSVGSVLESLERARREIEARTGLASRRLVSVVIYDGVVPDDGERAPHWVTGIFDGKIRVGIQLFEANAEQLDEVLAHEYVHALIQEYGGSRVHGWVHEGLANLLSGWGADRRRLTSLLDGASALLEIEDLRRSLVALPREDVALAYEQSYWMTRDLVDERGWDTLSALLVRLELDPSSRFDDAFAETYGESPRAYLERWYAGALR